MMPVVLKGILYLAGAAGFWSLAYEAGKKKGERDRATSVEGVSRGCVPFLTLPAGPHGLMRIVEPTDPEWCIALGYHMQLAACARSQQRIGGLSLADLLALNA